MATTSSFAHINQAIGLIAFCPELVQGTPNHSFTVTVERIRGPLLRLAPSAAQVRTTISQQLRQKSSRGSKSYSMLLQQHLRSGEKHTISVLNLRLHQML